MIFHVHTCELFTHTSKFTYAWTLYPSQRIIIYILLTKSMAPKYNSSHKVYICSMDVCGNVGRVDDESKNKFLKKLQEIFWRFR